MNKICSPQDDGMLGPFVTSACRDGFDFTLLFEQSILSLMPSVIYLAASLPRIRYLRTKNVKSMPNRALLLKLLIASIFLCLQVSLVVLWARYWTKHTPFSIVATVVNLVVAIQHFPITWLEDERSVRPSSLLTVYLLLTLLFDASQIRTLWLMADKTPIAAVFSVSSATKLLMLVVEARQKRIYLKEAYKGLPPESLSGIFSRSLLWWINDLIKKGYRSLIQLEDLYELDHDLTSAVLWSKANHAWEMRTIPERRYEFVWAMIQTLRWHLLATIPPRLAVIGFTFAQPALITAVLDVVLRPENELNRNQGYALIAASFFVYGGLAISRLHYYQSAYRFATMFRGAAVSMIYMRATQIQDGSYDESAAITLMSTDVDRIYLCLTQLSECWAGVVEAIIGVTLLALRLGWISVIPVIIILLTFLGTKRVAGIIGRRQKLWLEAVQSRIGLTASALANMKGIKMLGLRKTMISLIQGKRVEETVLLRNWFWCDVWQNMLANIPLTLAPPLVFVIYATVGEKNNLDTVQVFTSLSIIILLTTPAANVLNTFPLLASSMSCFDRIQKFMVSATRVDCRVEHMPVQNHPPPSSSDHPKLPSLEESQNAVIQMTDLSIRPSESADVLLRGVDLVVPHGSLCMVVGAVGTGKTTLLKAILGELPYESGSVSVSARKISFCSQSPWLTRGSIRDIICGPGAQTDFDEDWYRACLHACVLDEDLKGLAQGDQTFIEGGNAMLSGGQKQRVCLARTIYARADLFLLDDVLSALDVKTQRSISERLFGNTGLFRKMRASVVLISHASAYSGYADRVYELSDGTIRLSPVHLRSMTQLPGDDFSSHHPHVARRHSLQNGESVSTGLIMPAPDTLQDLKRKTGDIQIYHYYLKSFGWPKASTFLALVMAQTFCGTFNSYVLKWWSERGGGHVAFYGTIYFALAVLDTLFKGGYLWAMFILLAPSVARQFHKVVLDAVMGAPQSFFSKTESGVTLNRFSQDMTMIEERLSTGMILTVSALFTCIGSAIVVGLGSSYMAITLPFLALAVYVIQHVYLLTSRQLRLLDLEARSPLYSQFLTTVNGLVTIRSLGWEELLKKQNHQLLDQSQRPHYLLSCIRRWLTLVLDLVVGCEAVLVVGLALGLRHTTSAGLLGVSMNSILSFSTNLAYLVAGWTGLETSLGSVARIRDFERDVAPEMKAQESNEVSQAWPEKGAIVFRNVTASHDERNKGIKGVSFSIEPSQKIGICGRTGSGKSSLIGTLLRLLEIDSGSVFIDDVDLSTVSRDTIRERLVVIPQDPLVLSGTLRFNIDPAGAKSDADVLRVVERVGLTDMLTGQSDILNAELSPSVLSRGQQQLIGLARALLKQGSVVILDEATSNVDAATDAVMQKVLREDFAGRTILTVAHRIETIIDSDKIVVVQEGKIAEYGTPQELLNLGCAFAELAQGIGKVVSHEK